jgi:ABC-type transport system substrate-binding protein
VDTGNPEYDRLYAQHAVTIDPKKRVQIVNQMQKIVYEARTEIVLVYNDTIDAWDTKWTGFVESPNGLWTQFSKVPLESVHLS